MDAHRDRILILTGPTAAGKTKLSLRLAQALDGEIISADSMQVYRGMDIGTDKIRQEEMQGIPHHLIDILDPAEEFNVYTFQKLADEKIREITARGHLPLIVGGTGFYIRALLYHTDFTEEEDGGAYRAQLEARAKAGEGAALHEELCAVDPDSAEAIHANNIKRVIRALEYHHLTGRRISEHNKEQRAHEAAYDHLYFVLTDDRARLYDRIDARVDQMIAEGLADEVRGLLDRGLTGEEVSMQGLGYRQIVPYLHGECTLADATERLKRDTRHFAKRQLTWFRAERDVRLLDRRDLPDDDAILEEILRQVKLSWVT
ncbi:MAG: tRNA (adenosine(37)-N6)-dimethylallyltransferase MiaA [Lachnospiraceae bacterium]|nr:tRNA (adenosine(37)-N6)-dimethylallyltransferase MiaA [Lachnospiraceae bacterium]